MRKRLLGLALAIIMILGCSMITFAKTPEEAGMEETTTTVKEWGKAINSIQDLFNSLGDAVADGKAWYEGMKDGFQKTVAEAYIMNAGGLSVPRDAIIVFVIPFASLKAQTSYEKCCAPPLFDL